MSESIDHGRRDAGVTIAAIGGALALGLMARGAEASVSSSDMQSLNALLEAELDAIATYTTGAGVLMKPPAGDPDESIAATVLAVAVHFQSQHKDHAAALTSLIKSNGGTPITKGTAQIPTGFKPSVLNVIRLAANAEKSAALSYVSTLGSISDATAATLIAAIGGVEAEHFVVLYSLAKGLVLGTTTTASKADDLVPTSFVIAVGSGTKGLDGLSDFTFA